MTDLIATRDRPPRFRGSLPWERHLQIGFLIDWLAGRPEHAVHDDAALKRRASPRDMVALAAAVITRRLEYQWLELDGPIDHAAEYRVFYHDQIAGHLEVDELRIGDEVYRRLNAVEPDCLSGLVNLAELERRHGFVPRARALLEIALDRANAAPEHRRYNVPNRDWLPEIRCALARLEADARDGAPLLERAHSGGLSDLMAQLRGYPSPEVAAVAANRAFSVASDEQRVMLHAVMRLAPVWPTPPPAAHAQFEAIAAVNELVRKQRAKDAQPSPSRQWTPGPVASAVLKALRRLRRP